MSTREIRAAVVREPSGPFEVETVELEEPRANEVLVRVVGAGVCHTDLSVRDGHIPVPFPAVLGHEGSGVVEAVGEDVTAVDPGDHVVLSFLYDGTCPNCRAGAVAYCEHVGDYNFGGGRPTDGTSPLRDDDGERLSGMFFGQSSFATHALATERNTVVVDDDLPLAMLGPLGCGVLTGAGGVINTLDPRAGSSLVVFGTGSVGLSAVMAADAVGCTDIVAVDVLDSRLETARDLGATHAVDPTAVDDVEAAIRDHLGDGTQYALDTTGEAGVVETAIAALRHTGTCALVAPTGTPADLDVGHLLRGRSVTGVTMGGANPGRFVHELLDLHREGKLPFDELVTYYDFEEIERAIAEHEAGENIKPVLRMDDP